MQNVAEVFAAWPSDAELARDLGVPYPTISAWKQRESIPAAYWWDITRAARNRGHPEISPELLARLHARSPNEQRPAGLEEEMTSEYRYGPKAEADEADAAGKSTGAAHGHFSKWRHLRRSNFASAAEIDAHINALREEWTRR